MTTGSFLTVALGLAGGKEQSMGYSAVVLKCSHLIITLRTHMQAPRDGHAIGKATANASCLHLWKGEMTKEEWTINYVLTLRLQKGTLDGYMKIL